MSKGPFSDVAAHSFFLKKKVREKSRECHNHKTQPYPDPQEEEETDKSKQAQIEQMYEKH